MTRKQTSWLLAGALHSRGFRVGISRKAGERAKKVIVHKGPWGYKWYDVAQEIATDLIDRNDALINSAAKGEAIQRLLDSWELNPKKRRAIELELISGLRLAWDLENAKKGAK